MRKSRSDADLIVRAQSGVYVSAWAGDADTLDGATPAITRDRGDPRLFAAAILFFGPSYRNGYMIISYESDPEAIPRADTEAASRARNCSVVTMAFA